MANEIDEWVVARVGHGQPVSTEPEDVDVFVPEKGKKHRYMIRKRKTII